MKSVPSESGIDELDQNLLFCSTPIPVHSDFSCALVWPTEGASQNLVHNMLRNKGMIRLFMDLPSQWDFEIETGRSNLDQSRLSAFSFQIHIIAQRSAQLGPREPREPETL